MLRKNFSSGIRLLFVTLLLTVFSLGGAFPIAASSFNAFQGFALEVNEEQKLTANDGAANSTFGDAIALEGNTAVIGASRDSGSIGAAYIFIRNGGSWVQQAKLTATGGQGCDIFGSSVAISGDTVLVGAPSCTGNRQGAYVFVRNGTTWTQQAKLTVTGLTNDNAMGWSVGLVGDTAIVSEPNDASGQGATYVFVRSGTTWTQQAKLIANDGAANDRFGIAVDLSGETALIGAYEDDDLRGSAYVFARSGTTWTQQAKLTANDGAMFNQFGTSVALDGDTALIGAWSRKSAYVFVRSGTTWTQQARFENFSNALDVEVDGDTAVIGSPISDLSRGSAYVFQRSGTVWFEQARLRASDGQGADMLGWAVAVDGDTILAGAWGDDNAKGSAYVFLNNPNIDTELLVNGGFEVDSNGDFVPDSWTRKNPTGDGQRCNQPAQPAYEGSCSYLFKDDASGNNKLIQNVDLNVHDLNAGDKVKLTGFYNKQSAGSIQIRLFVTYASLPEDEAHITLTQTTSGYKAINPLAITLDAKPTRVRVQIQNQTTSGKTWFDGLSLKLTDNSAAAPLIPLPLPLP